MQDSFGHDYIVRAVLDSGSTASLMTERLSQRLNLSTLPVNRSILGINNATACVGKMCHVNMTSLNNSFSTKLCCFILPYITSYVPSREINISNIQIPTNICLADPAFYTPAEVDILIGADLFWDLLGSQTIKLGHEKPVLCETRLGWVISGPIYNNRIPNSSHHDIFCNFNSVNSFENSDFNDIKLDLTRFWQLEEVNSKSPHYFPEESRCEVHFVQNTTRLADGRFCFRIPLKQNPSVLGDSFQRAVHCLYSLERRLKAKPDLSNMYHEFMTEYMQLGHMSECEDPDLLTVGYNIPHHGILRESSTTTKLRVVFNASSPTTSGVSCNDIQMVGPTVQDDLLSILLRFRQHRCVLSADVEKMYRQIVVHPSDRHLQHVLWRDSYDEPIKKFVLNTVTYGTSSAPFLATRCLR